MIELIYWNSTDACTMTAFLHDTSLLYAFLSLGVAALLASLLLYSCIPFSSLIHGFLGSAGLVNNNGDLGHVENLERDEKREKKQSYKVDHRCCLPPGSLGLPWIGETLQFALFNSCPIGTPSPFLHSRLHRYTKIVHPFFSSLSTRFTSTIGLKPCQDACIFYVCQNECVCVRVYVYMRGCVYTCMRICMYVPIPNVCMCKYACRRAWV